jgi:hypothetical protein
MSKSTVGLETVIVQLSLASVSTPQHAEHAVISVVRINNWEVVMITAIIVNLVE